MSQVLEALTRAHELLCATRDYMKKNPIAAEYQVFYDETYCDGYCLMEDCDIARIDIELAIAEVKRWHEVKA